MVSFPSLFALLIFIIICVWNWIQTSSGVAKARTKSIELSKRGRSFLIQLRISRSFFFEGICQYWLWATKTENLGLWQQRMVSVGQRKQTAQWQSRQAEAKKKGNLKFKEPQHLSSFPLRDTMDTLTAFPSVSGGSDNPLRREGKFLQSQGA